MNSNRIGGSWLSLVVFLFCLCLTGRLAMVATLNQGWFGSPPGWCEPHFGNTAAHEPMPLNGLNRADPCPVGVLMHAFEQ